MTPPPEPTREPLSTVHLFRRRWKPHKQRLLELHDKHPTHMRFHRACSWLQRVEAIEDEADVDVRLMLQWIAFNALYSQWDDKAGEPQRDRECWRQFLDRVLRLDADGTLQAMLTEHKRLVLTILDDAYLRQYFWRDPSADRAKRTPHDRRNAPMWYVDGKWLMILEGVTDPIYQLRCQLVHGAATYKSSLNRTSVRRCSVMLGHLLAAVLSVWIAHGSDEDWGALCYPPQG